MSKVKDENLTGLMAFPSANEVSAHSKTSPHLSPYFCTTSGLYSFVHYLPQFNALLESQKAIGLICVDASDLNKIEYDYGSEVYNQILQQTVGAINELKNQLTHPEDILTVRHPKDDLFLLFLAAPRPDYGSYLKVENLRMIMQRFVQTLNAKILQLTFPFTQKVLKTDVGYAYAVHNPLLSKSRTIYRLIEKANEIAKLNGQQFHLQINEDLKEIIMDENIRTFFQPIIDVKDGSIYAYEALTRGPAGSTMESPLMLFGVADQTNLSFELDRLCRRKAIENAKGLSDGQKLFVNTFPTSLHDPEFKGDRLDQLLKRSGLRPENIVFEITEKFAIENYSLFYKEQMYYRDLGFSVAVDDFGSGYGSLEAIANLRPQYLKVDISITRNIHENQTKRDLLKAICDIAKKIKAKILIEGVEKKEELAVARAFNVDLAQGFLLAKPLPHLLPKEARINL